MAQVFAFAQIPEENNRIKVYESIKTRKSRFGQWEQTKSLHEKWNSKNAFLLRIKKDDWIVHINMPHYGKCVAVQVLGEYVFDEGFECEWGMDFRNAIPVNPETFLEFDRRDPNVLPSVNLAPRSRAQRVLNTDDFFASLENIRNKKFNYIDPADKSIVHLQNKINDLLPQITAYIQDMNKSKEFERFLHRIFEGMPNTLSIKNGFGWKTDHGADLIIEFQNPIIGINIKTTLIVQAKSYVGFHSDKNSIDQIVTGIKEYNGDAGLLITTAKETEELEKYALKKSIEIDRSIDIISGSDVAKFVLRYAPHLLIGN